MEKETKKRAECNTNEGNRKPNEGEKSPERQEIYILVHFFAHFVPFFNQKKTNFTEERSAKRSFYSQNDLYTDNR